MKLDGIKNLEYINVIESNSNGYLWKTNSNCLLNNVKYVKITHVEKSYYCWRKLCLIRLFMNGV